MKKRNLDREKDEILEVFGIDSGNNEKLLRIYDNFYKGNFEIMHYEDVFIKNFLESFENSDVVKRLDVLVQGLETIEDSMVNNNELELEEVPLLVDRYRNANDQYIRIKKELEGLDYMEELYEDKELMRKIEREKRIVKIEIEELKRSSEVKEHSVVVSDVFRWPLDEFGIENVTSDYGYREHPVTGKRDYHGGIDIAIPYERWPLSEIYKGNPVYVRAAEDGIAYEYKGAGYGNYLIVVHDSKYSTLYAHNYKHLVDDGERVKKGDKIAKVGSSGMSTGPHLHFEIWKEGDRINPKNLFN